MNLTECLARAAAGLSNDELVCELKCAERCVLLQTRTQREAALLRARCLRLEIERRKLEASFVLASQPAAGTRR